MIVKLIRMAREKGRLAELRDSIYALTRYVVDADPWALAMIEREQVRSLVEYLVHAKAHGVEPGEKAGHIGARKLQNEDLRGQQIEMLAVASSAPRVEFPFIHIIVSWPTGENPSAEQIDDTVETVLATVGLSRCPALYAEHTNTAHRHLHIAAVRIDPATERAAGSEWLIEDLHQAIAILEERHRWAAEPNALYYARGGAVFDANARRLKSGISGEKVIDPASEIMVRDAAGRFISQRDRRALPSDIVNLRADLFRARAEAKDWSDLHRLLDAHGLAYRTKGSGARIHLGDISAKASAVAPNLALKQLEATWGSFIPHPRDRILGFDQYRATHAAQLKRLRDDRSAAQAVLNGWAAEQLASVATANERRIERAIRAERDAAQEELNAAFAAAIRACTRARHVTAESWRAAGSPSEPPPVASPSLLLPESQAPERGWSPPPELRAEHQQWSTRYYDEADRLVFTDHRSVIVVHRPEDTDGLDAALKLAAERWRTVRVSGSDAFKQRCAERAAELGIALVENDNTPLVGSRPVAPAELAPQPMASAMPPRPDHRADPARQAELARVLSDLERMRPIPMRRSQAPGRQDANWRLEIVVEANRFDQKPALKVAALFDEDPLIQAFLEKHRVAILADLEHHLAQIDAPLDRKAVVDSLRLQEGLGRAAFLAFEDADFRAMLERVGLERAERQRTLQRAAQHRRREHKRQRAQLTMLARVFHDQSWDPREWRIEERSARPHDRLLAAPGVDDEFEGLQQLRLARSSADRTR